MEKEHAHEKEVLDFKKQEIRKDIIGSDYGDPDNIHRLFEATDYRRQQFIDLISAANKFDFTRVLKYLEQEIEALQDVFKNIVDRYNQSEGKDCVKENKYYHEEMDTIGEVIEAIEATEDFKKYKKK